MDVETAYERCAEITAREAKNFAYGIRLLPEQKRKAIYAEVQQILAEELPYINLWYLDNVLVHTNRMRGIEMSPAGNYDFLRTAELVR